MNTFIDFVLFCLIQIPHAISVLTLGSKVILYIVLYVLDNINNKNIYFVRNKILQHRHVDK